MFVVISTDEDKDNCQIHKKQQSCQQCKDALYSWLVTIKTKFISNISIEGTKVTPLCFNKVSDFIRQNSSQLKKITCLDQYCTLQWLSTHRPPGSKDQWRSGTLQCLELTHMHTMSYRYSKPTSAMFFGEFLCHVEIWRGQSSQD